MIFNLPILSFCPHVSAHNLDDAKPYLKAYPTQAKYFDKENPKYYNKETGKWKGAAKIAQKKREKHNAKVSKALEESDLMEDARKTITESFIEAESTKAALQIVAVTKDQKKTKKSVEESVKKAKGDLNSYNRNRWGMSLHANMVDENGTSVLCPPVFWKWRSGNINGSGESKVGSQ